MVPDVLTAMVVFVCLYLGWLVAALGFMLFQPDHRLAPWNWPWRGSPSANGMFQVLFIFVASWLVS